MDVYCSYYTKSQFITDYMIKNLNLQENDIIMEPSAGDGVFIDEILKINPNANIVAYDLNPGAIAILKNKYKNYPNIKIIHTDTLLDAQLDNYVIQNGYFDKVIGNPPYGAWQDYSKRDLLKKKYKGYYVRETYTLFLLRCVSLLKNKGILTFIIPDTFMNLHMHNALREFLLLNTKIKEILIFPSKFFPGVQYGYSKMCIITVEKTNDFNDALNNKIRIISELRQASDIDDVTKDRDLSNYRVNIVSQREIYNSVSKAFLIKAGEGIRSLINNSELTLGNIADCVTGIYTGDNKRFLKVASLKVKNNLSKCPVVEKEEINYDYLSYDNLLDGIDDKRHFIPVVKGSAGSYIRNNDWYIDWSKEAVNEYKTNKKARFQNSQFYFKKGIALPMVKSTKIKASLIENQVFDQSVVGVFPRNEEHLYYLLAFFNTNIFNKIVNTINPTANNSANYIKKVPIIFPNDGFKYVNNITEKIINIKRETGKVDPKLQDELDNYFNELYSEWLVQTEEENLGTYPS